MVYTDETPDESNNTYIYLRFSETTERRGAIPFA